ncbi:hypothetical protein Tco_1121195 [Tanacetum coccineum]|uniref:Uncharacterized protein n=1 Tax=Tanacetum coccineum TaxID=301880 RepID=A0ABQ5IYF5_9ASTR
MKLTSGEIVTGLNFIESNKGSSIPVFQDLLRVRKRIVADFSHAPPNEYSPSPDDKKQWSLVWFDFYKIPLCTLMTSRRLFKLHQCFRIWLKIGMLALGESRIQKIRKKELFKESFSRHCCYWIGGKLIVHAILQWFSRSKDIEIQVEYKFQDQENSKDNFSFGSALEDLFLYVFKYKKNLYAEEKSLEPPVAPVVEPVVSYQQNPRQIPSPEEAKHAYSVAVTIAVVAGATIVVAQAAAESVRLA